MSDWLLLVSEREELGAVLHQALKSNYRLLRADTPARADALLRRLPALVLLDGLLPAAPAWATFCLGCECSGRPTLLCCLAAEEARHTGGLPDDWLVLPQLAPPAVLRLLVRSLLQRAQAQMERDLAQGRLFEREQKLHESLRSAVAIQQSLMPIRFPDLPDYAFASCFSPCESVGGDLFNLMQLDEDWLALYMLDVSGHGVPAAMVTVSLFQALSPQTGRLVKQRDGQDGYRLVPPAEVLSRLDQEYPFERFDAFFTISYLLLHPASGTLRYASGAHPPPLLLQADGRSRFLDCDGTLIGLGGLVPFEEERCQLQPGDRLFLYTDGILEHENGRGVQFGRDRLLEVLQASRQLPLQRQCDRLLEVVHAFGHGQPPTDDVTLLAVQRRPEAAA
ncbi:MAG: PP2C family protein-serine/threonine phosphatase [Desulfuromonas thiophila]|jgi:sigma-B regulation protein RsbU (phosphoserine phosphatase)|nr:PP2C family protein-serine/threonine phosphatase [Desulfuromonas thiophila]